MTDSSNLLRSRCEAIPEGLVNVPAFDFRVLDGVGKVACSGLGLAGATAGFARGVFSTLGWNARMLTPSECFDDATTASDEALVVFSQNLSPNAQIVMSQQPRFERSVLVTSTDDGALFENWQRLGSVQKLPPNVPEVGLLVRVQGPAFAAYALLAGAAERLGLDLSSFAQNYREMFITGLELGAKNADVISTQPVGLVTAGAMHNFVLPLQWKLLEALWQPMLPSVDAINFVHGPMQAVHGVPNTLFFLGRGCSAHAELAKRLKQINGAGHTHAIFVNENPMVAAVLYDGFFNGVICGVLEKTDRDLSQWPGKGKDGPIYGITDSGFFE